MTLTMEKMESRVLVERYGDIHKIVLQGIMSAGFLDAKGVKNLFIGACKHLKLNTTERTKMAYVQQVVKDINDRVKPYDMAIRSASCELTGKKFYIFLVTVEKPIMKMQTLFTKFELELFQKIMNSVLREYANFCVPHNRCINMAKEIDSKFSIDMSEEFIDRMITRHYLAKFMLGEKKNRGDDQQNQDETQDLDEEPSEEFEVTLGIRTIREFEPTLREIYDDVLTNCHLCKMIMLHGFRCPKCPIFIHRACLTKYLATCKTCPGCRITWKEREMVKRVRHDEDEEEVSPSASNANTGGKSQRSNRRHSPSKSSKLPKPSKSTTSTPGEDRMPVLEPMVSRSRSPNKQKSVSPVKAKESSKNKGKKKAVVEQPTSSKRSTKRRLKIRISSSDEDD